MKNNMGQIASRWEQLGAMFNVAASAETPDLERLLLDTVRAAEDNTRFLIMAASWLTLYGEFVAKRRLAILVRRELELEFRPRMGLLLEWAQTHGSRNRSRFREALRYCKRAKEAGPLATVERDNEVLRELSRERASSLSVRWGCWMEDFDLKDDALRSARWISEHNPLLAWRAICGGDLVASILAEAGSGSVTFESESALARLYDASRSAVRDALLKMKLAGLAQQDTQGKNHPITISLGKMHVRAA